MTNECITPDAVVNPLPDIDFDVSDPDGWYRYVADSFVLTGLARRSGEAYAREVRILVRRVYPPLPDARAALRFHAHPALWLHGLGMFHPAE